MALVFIQKIITDLRLTEEVRRGFMPSDVGMGPPWPSIEHGHSGITAQLKTATFNVCETLNVGI